MAKKKYEAESGEEWEGERKVDVVAGPSSVAGKAREERQRRDPCSNPELAAMLPGCNKKGGQASKRETTRGPREDIYGPRDQ